MTFPFKTASLPLLLISVTRLLCLITDTLYNSKDYDNDDDNDKLKFNQERVNYICKLI